MSTLRVVRSIRSNLLTRAFLALFSIAVLAACGPLATGDSTRFAYERNATYPVLAGQSLFVELEIELEELGLDIEKVTRLATSWIPAGLRGESANATNFLFFEDVEVAEGWQARLWQARVVRERPFNDPEGDLTYRIDITVRVDVPEEAYDLTRRVSGAFVARDGSGSVPITFLVEAF